MRLICLLAIVSCAGAPTAPARRADDRVDNFVHGVMARLHVPGMAVAVVRNGAVVKLGTYGVASLEDSTPVTTETRFQLASTTKLYTATLVLRMVQDGILALEAPVATYLPDAPAAWSGITIAHLAAHASGIPGMFDLKIGSNEAAYAAIRDRPLAYPPGERSDYGGGDFDVLVHVLERVSGQPFTELLRTKVFEPLQFTCTSFEYARDDGAIRAADVVPHRAWVYRWAGEHQELSWFAFPPPTYAMGGAFSCVTDLVAWAQAMDRGAPVTSASERRAAMPFTLAGGAAGEFGVVFATGTLRGRTRYGHSGGPALADVVRLPDEHLTVIVLANQQRLNPSLAASIAGLELPPAAESPLADDQPELSRRLRAIAEGYARGQLDAAAFAPSVRGELVPELRIWGPVIAAPWPAIERWSLVATRGEASGSVRSYLAHQGPFSIRWTFTLDSTGEILRLEPTPD